MVFVLFIYFIFTVFHIPVIITDSLPDQGPSYSPGSTLQLTCSVDPQFGSVVITWTSTCTGNCFVAQQSSRNSIRKDILHAVDSGNHTCMVVDDVGNTGNATLNMEVSGIL